MRGYLLLFGVFTGSFASPAPAEDIPAGARATVNADSAPLYAEMSSSSTVLKKLPKGEVLSIAYSVQTGEGEWCSTDGPAPGYVLCRNLTRDEAPKPDLSAPLPPVLTPTAAPRPLPLRTERVLPPVPKEPAVVTLEQSALMSAAKTGNVTAIQLALGKGAIVNGRDKDGKTALMWAAYMGRAEAVTALLGEGADPNAGDNLGWTALEAAVWARHPAVLELLLQQGAAVDARDSEGRTPLMHAAQYGDLLMLRELLSQGADPNARNRFDQTPLMFAVALNDSAPAELLVSAGADVNAKDAAGRSVLINAVLAGAERSANVQWLLQHKADVNAKDNEGRTALNWALKKGHSAIAQLLKKNGATEW